MDVKIAITTLPLSEDFNKINIELDRSLSYTFVCRTQIFVQ